MTTIWYTLVQSPLGALGLAATERGLCRLYIGGEEQWLAVLMGTVKDTPIRDDSALAGAVRQLEEYLVGSRRDFDLSLDLQGSQFQRRVWDETSRIPYGQTRSYAQVAKGVGIGEATRAVGSALGRNPVPIIVPCHRVVRTDGSLGGYTGGLEIKRALLALEGCQ